MNIVNDIHLAAPIWLFAIPIIVLPLIFIIYKTRQALPSLSQWLNSFSHEVYRHPLAASLEKSTEKTEHVSSAKKYFSLLSYTLITTLLSISLAQPFKIGKKLPEPPRHRDIVFLVDTSVSMILRDYLVKGVRTERITVMKNVLAHFIDQLKGNRIQLIAYSEQAYTLVPLTTDYSLLKFQLQRLDAASLTGRSSDLSNAMLYALQNYTQATNRTGTKNSDENKPVFVMLTDANRPIRNIDPVIAAEYVALQGIRLHTIAIGAGSYAAEDQTHSSLIYHPARFDLLEKIAHAAQGRFFWAKDRSSLTNALRTINEGEKRRGHAEAQYIQRPLYFWPLIAAMIWLLLIYTTTLLPRLART